MQPRKMVVLIMMGLGLGLMQPRGATAQVHGPHVTVSPYGGWVLFHDDVNVDDNVVYGGRLGLMLNSTIGVEGTMGWMTTETLDGPWSYVRTVPGGGPVDEDVMHNGLDLILQAGRSRFRPYLVAGWQHLIFENDDAEWDRTTFHGWEVGAGLKVMLHPRIQLRFDARDVFFSWDDFPPDSPEGTAHNVFLTGGLTFALFGSSDYDDDNDGVENKNDTCPDSPAGALVDAKGCPLDSDGDGVFDGIDQCASTPKGATVNATGCPTDTDKDGVFDGIDKCAGTKAGVKVDATGCPQDADADGVPDGTDRCANTPSGAKVDSTGCPLDADKDGVPDGLDRCPNTPTTARVDKDGCPIEVTEKEIEMLDTGKITVRDIKFETNKADILPGSHAVLDEIGAILVKWPTLKIEVGGHADSRGTDKHNLELSQRRAQAVLDYILKKFPQVNASQYTAKGYGESQPVADNKTADGQAQNRRVEFKVLNTEELKKETEKRKTIEK
jgi:outer membrane protein OmpA-like peptidoglycan-associated protein